MCVSGGCLIVTRLALYWDHANFMSFEIALFFDSVCVHPEKYLGTPCRRCLEVSPSLGTEEHPLAATVLNVVSVLRRLLTDLVLSLYSAIKYLSYVLCVTVSTKQVSQCCFQVTCAGLVWNQIFQSPNSFWELSQLLPLILLEWCCTEFSLSYRIDNISVLDPVGSASQM